MKRTILAPAVGAALVAALTGCTATSTSTATTAPPAGTTTTVQATDDADHLSCAQWKFTPVPDQQHVVRVALQRLRGAAKSTPVIASDQVVQELYARVFQVCGDGDVGHTVGNMVSAVVLDAPATYLG